MRLTFALFAMALPTLGLLACGRTDLEPAGYEGDDSDGGGGSGAGGSGASGGSRVSSSAGSFAGSRMGGSFASGGSILGGTQRTGGGGAGGRSTTGGFSVVGGTSWTGGRSGYAGTTSFAGSFRTGGTMIGGYTMTGGTIMAGRIGGSGGTLVGGRSSTRGGTTVIGGSRTGGAGGVISTGGTSRPGSLARNEELIDDMNDGDRFLAKAGGRVGAWKVSNDGTPGGTMYPDPNSPFVPTDTGDPEFKSAVYVKASGFVSDTSSSFSLGLGAPYNASKYTGISFWAKSDTGSQYARVLFPDKDTDPDAGLCSMSGAASNRCYDHYGYRFQFAPGWNKYIINWKSLTQDGWGRKGNGFDPSTLFEIVFQFPANASYAVWLDNLAFTM